MNLVDFQTSTKYFFDTAQQCFDHCIKDFSSKDMNPQEKECTQGCITKQLVVFSSLVQNLNAGN